METKKITLIQPRHIYAPNFRENQIGHIYIPTSLLTAAAILIDADQNIEIIDENLNEYNFENNILGINLIGPPYIPVVIEYISKLKRKFNNNFSVFLGGQIINCLTPDEFTKLFAINTYNGNNFSVFSKVLQFENVKYKCAEEISLIKAYKKISDENLRLYLSTEQSFYLSQGCKYFCTFCTAKRSGFNPWLNQKIRTKEIYRDIEIALLDIEYLITKSLEFGLPLISLYLSNLDLFQSPKLLFEFAQGLIELRKKYANFPVRLRGLSTVKSFLQTDKTDSGVIHKTIEAGLYQIGFGVDGATYEIYKKTKKPQTPEECLQAIRILYSKYNIIPETLMVFGHNHQENKMAMEKAYDFSLEMNQKYGAVPRPHVAKNLAPGNDGWYDPRNQEVIQELINYPWLFQNLDFTALASTITHPDNVFRNLINDTYLKICSLPNSLSKVVKPFGINPSEEVIKFNSGKYDI